MKFAKQPAFMALIAGLLAPLAFSPFDFSPALFISLALAWYALSRPGANDTSPALREALFRGWSFGAGFFGFGTYWLYVSIHEYGFTPLWLAIPFTGLFAAAMALYPALLFAITRKLPRFWYGPIVFAACWVLIDWLRGWLFTGFPWIFPGYAMIDLPLARLGMLQGIWLVSFAAVLSSVALALVIQSLLNSFRPADTQQTNTPTRQKQLVASVLVSLCLWATSLPLDHSFWTQPAASEKTKIALVQGNIPQDLKWQLEMRETTKQIYSELSSTIPGDHLVIWPEAAMPDFYQDNIPFMQAQADNLAENNSALISGVPWRELRMDGYHFFNSIISMESGVPYHKQKLVPFGEYVPLQSLLRGIIPFFDLPMSSFTSGKPEQDNLLAKQQVIAPFICYEILYPELVAQRSQQSNTLLTISNDAWFGASIGPHQHFQMARMRAVETGRWLLRSTNTGITAVINPTGEVVDQLEQFQRGTLLSSAYPMTGNTPYMQFGGTPFLIVCGLLSLLSLRKHS